MAAMIGTDRERWIRWLAPLILAVVAIGAWDLVVRLNQIPPYILPGPALVLRSLISDWPTLWPSLLVTVRITALALAAPAKCGPASVRWSRANEHALPQATRDQARAVSPPVTR